MILSLNNNNLSGTIKLAARQYSLRNFKVVKARMTYFNNP